jgi:hypothetical protein
MKFERAAGEAFQAWFGKHPASVVMGKLMARVAELWTARLMSVGSSVDEVRQAQGALDALGVVETWAMELAEMSLEEKMGEDDDGLEFTPADLEEVYG